MPRTLIDRIVDEQLRRLREQRETERLSDCLTARRRPAAPAAPASPESPRTIEAEFDNYYHR